MPGTDPHREPHPDELSAARERPWHVRGGLLILLLAAVVYVADRQTKAWALSELTPGRPRELIGEILQLRLVFNPGAAFSLGTGSTWVFTIVQAAVSIGIVVLAWRIARWQWRLGLGLVLGGALGNLTDRLTREPGFGVGHVVDFLELPNWPVFNIADSAIVSGAVILAAATIFGVPAFLPRGPAQPTASERTDQGQTDQGPTDLEPKDQGQADQGQAGAAPGERRG